MIKPPMNNAAALTTLSLFYGTSFPVATRMLNKEPTIRERLFVYPRECEGFYDLRLRLVAPIYGEIHSWKPTFVAML